MLDVVECEIVGYPDFLIWEEDGYIIRDSKMARRVDEDNHPEIIRQVGLYAFLFEMACGEEPKAIQVHCGTNAIVDVPYDGGASALTALRRIVALRKTQDELYQPVGWSKCAVRCRITPVARSARRRPPNAGPRCRSSGPSLWSWCLSQASRGSWFSSRSPAPV